MKAKHALSRFPAARRLAAAAALGLGACMLGEKVADGPSTETGNPALAGILRESSGRPAVGARVRLYRIPLSGDSLAPIPLDSLRTGSDGAYRFDSLAAGATYALEGTDAARSAFAFLPGAEIPDGAGGKFLRRDTLVLKLPGRLHGVARRDSNPRPPEVVGDAGILVRVIGLDRATFTDSAGRYALDEIPEGAYRIHYMAADGHYLGEVAGPVAVAAGSEVELAPVVLDWSPFVAPPAPAGLEVASDSAAGVLRLRWNRVFLPNLDHYLILRSDSPSTAPPDTFRTRDTAYADSVGHLPAGRVLHYRVLAVNTLGSASEVPPPRAVPVPAPPDTAQGDLEITALVLSGGVPARALVRLYSLYTLYELSAPETEDRFPRGITLVDSARAGADGSVRFAGRRAGSYTLAAAAETGADVAARVGVSARKGGAPDTLRLAPPGGLQGLVTRRGVWCADMLKQNENIEAHLAGTAWHGLTDYEGRYGIQGVPAGDYRLVLLARPRGCFLPDTVAVSIASGGITVLPDRPVRPDSAFIPRVAGLTAAAEPGGGVRLRWPPVPYEYPDPQGYEVSRRDAAGAVTASSGPIPDTAWIDGLTGLPSGTRVSYVVRALAPDGRRGPPGGDLSGNPVYFTVP